MRGSKYPDQETKDAALALRKARQRWAAADCVRSSEEPRFKEELKIAKEIFLSLMAKSKEKREARRVRKMKGKKKPVIKMVAPPVTKE